MGFKSQLLSLDARLIARCASVFDRAQYRRSKGAVKLHLWLDRQGLLPSYALNHLRVILQNVCHRMCHHFAKTRLYSAVRLRERGGQLLC